MAIPIPLPFSGLGSYTAANGDKYFGEWKDGAANGYGIIHFAINNSNFYESYEGDWRNNKRHGNGIFTWVFGDRYEG